MNGIWSDLVGQDDAVERLTHAVTDARALERGEAGPAMTHSWLITGPPGSGRSSAAAMFATALVCPEDGCGQCKVCRLAPRGGHPDVHLHVPEGSVIPVDTARELVRLSSQSPLEAPWRVIVVEDADRLNESASNALLKSLEEPTPHTVWVLCAPSVQDVLPTIASRVRHVGLRTPSTADVAALLRENYGIDASLASMSARASQGHIGRARALAANDDVRIRRNQDLRIPLQLRDLPSCFVMAADIYESATAAANERADRLDAEENQLLKDQFYAEGVDKISGVLKRSYGKQSGDLGKEQKRRRKRMIRDEVDRTLVDLIGLYRDVLSVQWDAPVELINEELRPQIATLASASTPADTTRRLEALHYARTSLAADVAPALLLEALMVELKDPWLRSA